MKKKSTATSADALLAHVQPLVDRFARQLAEMQAKFLNASTERAMGDAIANFEGLLGLRAEGAIAEKPRKARAPRAAKASKERRVPACSSCGESGHNARSCTKASDGAGDDEEPTPAKRRVDSVAQAGADRYAKIEASAARRNGAAHG